MKRKLVVILACILFGVSFAMAQTRVVSGTVFSEEDGEPVVGASVLVEGTTIGTITDIDGNFSLNRVPSNAKSLRISFIGLQLQSVAIKDKMQVYLKSDAELLEEVMVVAFGTAKKSAFTGSAGVIDTEKISKRQTSNITNALAGQVAGVQLTSSSGEPGKSANIRIRGIGSISASNTPLYVIDGVPYDGDISAINSQDIESMTVLKDAASNALYGARGANGVVLITTKKGQSGTANITVDAKWGTNRRGVPNYKVIKDPARYYELSYLSRYNALLEMLGDENSAHNTANKILINPNEGGLGYNVYTLPEGESLINANGKLNPNATLGRADGVFYYTPDNWYDEIFDSSNLRQEYNVSISGANDKVNYYISAGYLDDSGIIPNSGFTRFTTRTKIDYQAKNWLRVGANMSYVNSDSQSPKDQEGSSSANMFYVTNNMAPIYPLYVRDSEGNIEKDSHGHTVYDFGNNTYSYRPFMTMSNPASMIALDKRNFKANIFSGKWYANINILPELKLTYNLGYDVDDTRFTNMYNAYYGQYSQVGGVAYIGHSRLTGLNQQVLLNFNKSFDLHTIEALAGFESYDFKSQILQGSKEKLYNPSISEIDNAISNPSAYSSTDRYATQGWLARVQYDYDSRYFASLSYRRDGSSRFHKDNRWGNFGSIGGGWLINKEQFLENVSWIDLLKFKISYGIQGNDKLLYQGSSSANYYPYTDQFNVSNFNDDFAVNLYYKGNKDITWETSHSFNTGFDFTLFKGRLEGSLEYFSRRTSDLLYYKPVAPSLGYSHFPMNVGSMYNRGLELGLYGVAIDKNEVNLGFNFNMTYFKNKINKLEKSLGGELIEGVRIYREGESLYQMYLRKYAGVDVDTGEALYYKDIKGEDGNITQETTSDWNNATRYGTGDILPKVYGGFGATLNVYDFDFSISFSYQLGGKLYDSSYQGLMHPGGANDSGQNWHKDIENAWSVDNTNTNIPRLHFTDRYANSTSDRFLISSNYLNVQNITLGYNVPKNLLRKIDIKALRFYVVADNVALLTKRKGLDPRQGYLTSDNSNYSPIRTISGGLTLTF